MSYRFDADEGEPSYPGEANAAAGTPSLPQSDNPDTKTDAAYHHTASRCKLHDRRAAAIRVRSQLRNQTSTERTREHEQSGQAPAAEDSR